MEKFHLKKTRTYSTTFSENFVLHSVHREQNTYENGWIQQKITQYARDYLYRKKWTPDDELPEARNM